MKLKVLLQSSEALTRLIKCSLPINIGWKLAKFVKLVNSEISDYQQIHNTKIKSMGELKDAKYYVKSENMELFTKEITELHEKEIDINIPEIKIKTLLDYKNPDGSGINLQPDDLLVLDWLIVE